MFFSEDMPPLPNVTFDIYALIFRFFSYIRYVFNWLDSVKVRVLPGSPLSLLDFVLACSCLAVILAAFIPPFMKDPETGELYNDEIYDDEDFDTFWE